MPPSLDLGPATLKRLLRGDFVRHGALVFGASMLMNVLNYVFNFAVSRHVGVENFATLSSLTSAIMILSIPASILNLIVVKYAAEFKALGELDRLDELATAVLRLALSFAALALLLGFVLRGLLASFLNIRDEASVVLTLFVLTFAVATPSLRGILQGRQDFKRFSLSLVIEAVLKTGLAVLFVYNGYGVAGAMMGWALGTASAVLFTAVVSGALSPRVRKTALSIDYRRLIKTSIGVGLGTGALTVLSFIDVPLVKHYFPAHDAGLYAAANLTGKIVLFVVGFVPLVLLPKAVDASRRGRAPLPLLLQAAGATVLISGLVLALFCAFPERVITLLAGPAFRDAAPFVFQYDFAMALLAVVTVVVNYKIGLHRFSFVVPLGAGLVFEVLGIILYHGSLWSVIHVLLFGNGIVCAVLVASSFHTRASGWPVGVRLARAVNK